MPRVAGSNDRWEINNFSRNMDIVGGILTHYNIVQNPITITLASLING